MFDPKIPYNNMPLLPISNKHWDENTMLLLAQANNELGKLSGLSSILPDKDILIAPLLTKEAVSSSEIENILTTTQSVLQADALWKKQLAWPEKEVLHYRDALMLGLEKLKIEWGISTNTIIQIQWILEEDKKGIRKIPGTVIATSTWEVLHTPPEWEILLLDLLKNIEEYFHSDNNIDPLMKIAECHYQFETIHPFLDGNWRTWRILIILQLLQSRKLEYPILYLSEYIMKSKKEYYQLFQETREELDVSKFVNYILLWIIEQSKITQTKILGIQKLMEETIIKINKLWLNGYEITKALVSTPYLSISELWVKTWLTRQTASKHATILINNWIAEMMQIKNSKFISLIWFIELIS